MWCWGHCSGQWKKTHLAFPDLRESQSTRTVVSACLPTSITGHSQWTNREQPTAVLASRAGPWCLQESLEAGVRTSLGQSSGLDDYSPHDECFLGSESFENLIKAAIPGTQKNAHGHILPSISGDQGLLETISHLLVPHGPCMSYLLPTDTPLPTGKAGGPGAQVWRGTPRACDP